MNKEKVFRNDKNTPLPIGRPILVYAYNIKTPGWYIDKYTKFGDSDFNQLNGKFYPHNISHWMELPEKP